MAPIVHTRVVPSYSAPYSAPVTPYGEYALSPRVVPMNEIRPDYVDYVDSNRAAVISCRMLAEAGRNAAIRSASEAARQAEIPLRLENDQLNYEIRRLKERNNAQVEIDRVEREEIAVLKAEVDLLKAERDGLVSEVSHLKHVDNEREGVIASLRRTLDDERDALRRSLEEVDRLQASWRSLENERESLLVDVQHLKSALSQRDQQITNLRESHNEERNAVRLLQIEVDTLKAAHVEDRSFEIREAELLLQKESDIEALKRAGLERDQTISGLRDALEEERNIIRVLRIEGENLKANLGGERGREEELVLQLRELEYEKGILQTDVGAYQRAGDEKDKSISSLRLNLDSEQGTQRLLREEVETMKARLELQMNVDRREGFDLKVVENERDQLKTDVIHLKNALKEREREIETVRYERKTQLPVLGLDRTESTSLGHISRPSMRPPSMGAVIVDLTDDMSPANRREAAVPRPSQMRISSPGKVAVDLTMDDGELF
jgi:chromosome segregation ATPase